MKNRILMMLLSLLGFATACDKQKQDELMCMYGSPHIGFRVQGKVTNAAGQPIPGIVVGGGGTQVATGADGNYDLSGDVGPLVVHLIFTDVDGAESGGEFAEAMLEVKFTKEDQVAPGDGNWNKGGFAKTDMNIALQEKE